MVCFHSDKIFGEKKINKSRKKKKKKDVISVTMSNMSMINEYARLCELNLKKKKWDRPSHKYTRTGSSRDKFGKPRRSRTYTHVSDFYMSIYECKRVYLCIYRDRVKQKSTRVVEENCKWYFEQITRSYSPTIFRSWSRMFKVFRYHKRYFSPQDHRELRLWHGRLCNWIVK